MTEQELRALRIVQANKDFYIPSVAEVIEFYETDALLSDKPYQDLIRFLERELGLEYVEVDLIGIVACKNADISGYDRIGIASGVTFGKYYPQVLKYLK